MKTMNKILFVAALGITVGLANHASAQYQAVGDDGIAASPRVRQQLNERKAARPATATIAKPASPTVASVGYGASRDDGIAASPKVRQMLNERKAVVSASSAVSEVASAGYRATGADGITASPKLRQQLNERTSPQIIIAPLK
jgi:hypothetical protein